MSVYVEIASARVAAPMVFTLQQTLQIHSRSWLRPQSMFKQLWKTTRIIHYTSGIFSVVLKPASTKRATDIWRMDSQSTYVKGEESLIHWHPRSLTLVRDYARFQRARRRATDVESTKVFLRRHRLPPPPNTNGSSTDVDDYTPHQERLLQKSLTLWTTAASTPSVDLSLSTSTLRPHLSSSPPAGLYPTHGHTSPTSIAATQPPLTATISHHPKNPILLKSSFLLTPTTTNTPSSPSNNNITTTRNPATKTSISWLRHFAELRSPYLHLYSVPSGEEAACINLRNARIDVDPPIQRLLDPVVTGDGGVVNRSGGSGEKRGKRNIFACYARGSSWIFAARSEEEKGRWVLAIDEAFLGTDSGGGGTPA